MERMYGLYEKRGFRWHRLGVASYRLGFARVVWQNELLAPSMKLATNWPVRGERRLRPVPDDEHDATGENVPFAGGMVAYG